MNIQLRTLNRRELAGFRPYLLPDACRLLAQGSANLIAMGAVGEIP